MISICRYCASLGFTENMLELTSLVHCMAIIFISEIQNCPTFVNGSSEKRLITTLLENYNENGVEGRPVLDSSRSLTVSVSFSLIHIVQFDEKTQLMTLVGWIHLQWRDALLRWNASEYDNIHQVVLHPRQIWTPDVVLINAVKPPKVIHDTKLLALNSGLIIWVTHVLYELSCPSSSIRRPDEPDCELRFGSWTLNADMVRMQGLTNHLDTTYYIRHHEWDLIKSRVKSAELQYPWCPGVKFSFVGYRITMRRHWQPTRHRIGTTISGYPSIYRHRQWVVTVGYALFSYYLLFASAQ